MQFDKEKINPEGECTTDRGVDDYLKKIQTF